MIAHIVLLRPRPDLSPEGREALATALRHALTDIPGILRAKVGLRLTLGRYYDSQNAQDFPYAAFLEFASEADLRAYLEHPAHRELGQRFYQSAEAALAFDFVLKDAGQVSELV